MGDLVRCKVVCGSVGEEKGGYREDGTHDPELVVHKATFYAVCDGSEENKRFFASTPTLSLEVGVVRGQHFAVGQEFYIDFVPVKAG